MLMLAIFVYSIQSKVTNKAFPKKRERKTKGAAVTLADHCLFPKQATAGIP